MALEVTDQLRAGLELTAASHSPDGLSHWPLSQFGSAAHDEAVRALDVLGLASDVTRAIAVLPVQWRWWAELTHASVTSPMNGYLDAWGRFSLSNRRLVNVPVWAAVDKLNGRGDLRPTGEVVPRVLASSPPLHPDDLSPARRDAWLLASGRRDS